MIDLDSLIREVTLAVDEVEQRLRTDPLEYLSFQQASNLRHSISRLERIVKEN